MNNKANAEVDLRNQALKAFERETGLKIVYELGNELPLAPYVESTLQIGEFDATQAFNVEIKFTINELVLAKIVAANRINPEMNILITRYAPLNLARKMRDLHIQFIDTAGNAYINRAPRFIFLYGNKAIPAQGEDTTDNLFGMAGIRVVFALLCKNNLVRGPYRDIADAAGVALGTVAGVMKVLIQQQYLIELVDRGRILVKKKELADHWMDAYITKFRGRRLIGRYTAPRELFWRDADLYPVKAMWGGEVAAQKLTHYLKPEIITIYTHKPVDNLVLNLKLRKEDKGPIEVREQFWNFEIEADNRNTVPPLLAYADLIAVGDTRTLEAAEMVNDEFLKRYFK
jgi:hypothetical protein